MKKNIKKLLLLALLMVAAVACKYDDGELWDKVNSLDDRLTSIETQLSQMNSDISSLSTIVNALQNKVYVTSVDEFENGCQITFTDGKIITVTNGKDGADGKDGINGADGKDAPIISVDEFEGKYYWAQIIDGNKSWLTDKDGAKIPVTGDDGITPIMKVNAEGYWVISYDRGITFELLLDETNNPVKAVGKAGADGKDGINGTNGTNGLDGDSFFSDVRVENGELVLVLVDGTELRLPIENSNTENTKMVEVIINGISDEVLTIESVLGSVSTQNNTYSIPVYDDLLPQLLTVTDENGNIIMMARKFYESSESLEINAETTALALITTNPLFSLIDKEHFSELEELILNSPQFPKVLSEIQKSIEARRDIYDTNNVELLLAISNLMEDICGQNVTEESQSRATISNWLQLNINDPYPFIVEIEGNVMSITNTALSPAYKGSVTHPNIGTKQLNVPTREGYGGWELIQQAAYGYNPDLFWADLGNGDPVTFTFTEEGEYHIDFTRNDADFYWNLIKDLFNEFGLPKVQEFAIKKVIDDVVGQLWVSGVLAVQPGQDPIDFLASIGGYTIDVLQSETFKESEQGKNFYAKFPNGNIMLEQAKRSLKYWTIIKGSSNALLRIGWKIKAPQKVQFCLCLYESQVTSCSTVELVKKESTDNQEGYAGQALLEPLEVFVSAHSEDGSLVETAYQKVKFEVVSGGGSLSEEIVGTEGSYFTGTFWMLGDDGEQKVKAVAIDVVTGQEISEPVYFTATLNDAPTVAMLSATANDHSSVTVTASISRVEGVVESGFMIAENSDFFDAMTYIVENATSISAKVSDLTEKTTYYVKAYVCLDDGRLIYSEPTTVTTLEASLFELVGTYVATEYDIYTGGKVDTSYDLTIDVNGTEVIITNLWRGGKTIVGTYDETTHMVTIPTQQLIYVHPSYGDVKMIAVNVNDGISTETNAVVCQFTPNDGLLVTSAWKAMCEYGSFGCFRVEMVHK